MSLQDANSTVNTTCDPLRRFSFLARFRGDDIWSVRETRHVGAMGGYRLARSGDGFRLGRAAWHGAERLDGRDLVGGHGIVGDLCRLDGGAGVVRAALARGGAGPVVERASRRPHWRP